MKKYLLVISFFYFCLSSVAQPTGSFYLNMPFSFPYYSNDAIYFNGIKMDYDGNIIWSKSIPVNIVEGNVIYGTNGTKVLKYDTAGNFIWAKDFSAVINPNDTINTYNFADIFFDGSKLFVSIEQNNEVIAQYGGIGNQAIITLDTSGNIISEVIDTFYISTTETLGFKSLRKGGWFGYYEVDGSYHHSWIEKVDSTGKNDVNAKSIACFHGDAYLHDVVPTVDSNYLVVFNQVGVFGGAMFCIVKINENGDIIWYHSFSEDSISSSSGSFTEIQGLATDSTGHIYILANAASANSFLAKLDSTGKVVSAKAWSRNRWSKSFSFYYPSRNDYHGRNTAHYKNGKIYCLGSYGNTDNPTVYIFDTLLNNSCYGPDSVITLYEADSAVFVYNQSNPFLPFVYTPTDSVVNINPKANPAVHSLCMAINVSNISGSNDFVSIFPNPASTELTIHLPSLVRNEMVNIKIINVLGDIMNEEKVKWNYSQSINIKLLPAGIYFLQMTSENERYTAPFIKE